MSDWLEDTVFCLICDKKIPKLQAIDDSIPWGIDEGDGWGYTEWEYRFFCSEECKSKEK